MSRKTRTPNVYRCVSPVDGRVYAERPVSTEEEVSSALAAARRAQRSWKRVPIDERAAVCTRFVEAFTARREEIAGELTWQMGRPVRDTPSEVDGVAERAGHMIALAADALADIRPAQRTGYRRFIRREPCGVVLVLAPWNYPYLTAVNAIVPALMAGNAVAMKPSGQTFLSAERFAEAFEEAGLPEGLFRALHLRHAQTANLIRSPGGPDFVSFTGSPAGGTAVQRAAAERTDRFVGVALELGGKDAAYVRADADVSFAADGLVDGGFYNAGQSCCGVERIYVHHDVHDRFVEALSDRAKALRLGDPTDAETTLGPVVRTAHAQWIRRQVQAAIEGGARPHVDPAEFPRDEEHTPYVAPQVLTRVSHEMDVMTEETFGPVVGIMSVSSDDEAVRLVNDSTYGLTASVWTTDEEAADRLASAFEVGTVYMNRCDYLDPALAWSGVKSSGRGVSLSPLGYGQLTQTKSIHFRTDPTRH